MSARNSDKADEPAYIGKVPSPRDVDVDVAVTPGTSRSSTVIQQRLLGETEYQAVLKLVERYLAKFDVDNMVTAMHMCALAAKESEHKKRQIMADSNFAVLFNAVKEATLEDCAALSPRTASDLLWSCAHLSIFDRDLFTAVVADATRRMDTFSAKGISVLAFALGWVGHAPRASFMQALVRELRARVDSEFDPRGLTMIVFSLMRLGIRDQRLLKIVSDYMLRTGLEGFTRSELVQMSYALAKLEYFDYRAFSLLGRETLSSLTQFDPHQVIMSALAFAYASGQVEDCSRVMEGIKEFCRHEVQMSRFSDKQLASYAHAIGKHKVLTTPPEKLRRGVYILTDSDPDGLAIADQVCRRKLDSFSVQEIILICYGLMRIEHKDEALLNLMAVELTARSAELTPIELVNALYAFARLEFVHIPFTDAMVQELKRRDMVEDMSNNLMATLVYSLAVSRINVPWIMDIVAMRTCASVREMGGQTVAMIMWAMAVLDSKTHAEAVASACTEDMSKRLDEYAGPSVACVLWSTALLTGTSSALWCLEILFARNFWIRDFDPTCYAMIYVIYAALAAEVGLDMAEVYGYENCRGVYEEYSGQHMSLQNTRLADRLRMNGVPHEANELPPALAGFRAPGVRADIVLESLRLIIEVEGPHRMTIPLEQYLEQLKEEEEGAKREAEKRKEERARGDGMNRTDDIQEEEYGVFGKPEDVLAEARAKLECNLTGSAAFKRRILRKCGWKMVTISFDENEEYVVDALTKMNKDDKDGPTQPAAEAAKDSESAEEAAAEEPSKDDKKDGVEPAATTIGGEMSFLDPSFLPAAGQATSDTDSFAPDFETPRTEYEERLREKHHRAMMELERRVAEVQGNAVSASSFRDHFEYRKHQVALEKEVFRELVESGV